MNLNQFFEELDVYKEPIPLICLKGLLNKLEVDIEDVCECMEFSDKNYTRNLLHRGRAYEALLLCFAPGQRTPIHDHAGSACGVKVIKGNGTETIFERSEDGWLYATGSNTLPEGGVVGSNDMDTHQLSNLQPEAAQLVTMHIYSPPLGKVGSYSLTDNTVKTIQAATRIPPTVAVDN